jgi:spore germination protein GerM
MFQASQSRRWITREEIAEIHEARADRLQTAGKELLRAGQTPTSEGLTLINEGAKIRRQARDTRAAELLSNPIGARTA